MTATNMTAGMLYGTDANNSEVPVCCTPEFLAAYGVGLDSTYGDGVVSGVLREDQAESAFMGMFGDQYAANGVTPEAGAALQAATKEIERIVKEEMPDEEVNVGDILRRAFKDDEDHPESQEAAGSALEAVVEQLKPVIAGMEPLLTAFFGADTVKEAEPNPGSEENMDDKLTYIMMRTVLSGYDVDDNSDYAGGEGNQNGQGSTITGDDVDVAIAGEQPRVSLGEIAQWSMETGAYMALYDSAGAGDSVAQFSQRLFSAVSTGDTTELDTIGTASGMTHEQLQVMASVMMNNHASLMATGGNVSTSGKNGAHEYLNNINGGNDQAFQMLHIGNVGSAGMDGDNIAENGDGYAANGSEGNDNLNTTRDRINGTDADNPEAAIFNAGDNGQGSNGNFGDVLGEDDGDNISALGTAFGTLTPTTAPDFTLTDELKGELLTDLTAMGAGDPNGDFPGATISIGELEGVEVSIESSEDFENEGYDVVIINLKDTDGNVLGSMTATEAGTADAPQLVEYADDNGDGIVDAVDAEGSSAETTDLDGDGLVDKDANALVYHTQSGEGEGEEGDEGDASDDIGMVDWAASATANPELITGVDEFGNPTFAEGAGLAMNESMDGTGDLTHMLEDFDANGVGIVIPSDTDAAEEGLITGWTGSDSTLFDPDAVDTPPAGGAAAPVAQTGADGEDLVATNMDGTPMTAEDMIPGSAAALAAEGETIYYSTNNNYLIAGVEYTIGTGEEVVASETYPATATDPATDPAVDPATATGETEAEGDAVDPVSDLGWIDNGDETFTDPDTDIVYEVDDVTNALVPI